MRIHAKVQLPVLKKARAVFYKPFEPLERISEPHDTRPYKSTALDAIESLINAGDYYLARIMSAELIDSGLRGLHYLQTYERTLIRGIVTFAYTGWVAYSSLYIFRPLDQIQPSRLSARSSLLVNVATLVTLFGFWALFKVQQSPLTFYVYIAFPCYFWRHVLLQGLPSLPKLRGHKKIYYFWLAIAAITSITALQGMVVSD
jgi:phosphatidylinositol glycan class N